MANDAKFNFYLNRTGPRGQRGEKGDQGFSPSITVNTNTADEYTLLIQNEYDSLVTDNIRPTYDDRGGTYVRVDRANNVQYFGSADIATTANYGEVKLAQASDLASTVDVGNSNVITAELLKTWFDGQVADNLVTTTNNVTIQGQKVFATPTRFMDTVRIGNRLLVAQEDTGTITFDSSETGTVIGTHLTSTGDANFTKNITVDGTATIEGGLNVAGNAVISSPQLGNTTISGGLTTKAGINIQGQDIHLQHTNPTMYLKNMNGVNEIEIFRGLFTAGNPSPADNYLSLGHGQLQLNLTGKAIKANGKDVATADTVEAMQSDLNIAKQDIIEAQGDIDNLQMNKQNKLTAGTGITIDADNVISATGGVVDIPIASSTTLGGIKVGENLTISEDGTLSATGGGGGGSVTYTAEAPLSISADNVISIDTTDLGGTTLKKDASSNVDYALDLTANGTVGGTSKAARAESNESRHDAYMAFSGHNPSDATSTLWGPDQRKTGSWVELYLPDGVVPYSAAWTYGSTGEILPAVELLASNDGSSYTSLGSVEGVSTVTASMTFNTTDSYKYLRFEFRDACVSSAWGKFGLTSLKVKSSEVTTYTELFIGDNIDVTNGVMNVNSLSGEVTSLTGEVNTLSGEVAGLSGDIATLQNNIDNKQNKLTAGQGIAIDQTANTISSTTPITYLTRAQYDALETKDANTMYVITDEEGGSGGRNVGEIIQSSLPLTDAGLHLLDGTRLSGDGIYKEFVDYIANIYKTKDRVYNPDAFTVVGNPTITDDGVASGLSNSNFIRIPFNSTGYKNFKIKIPFKLIGQSIANNHIAYSRVGLGTYYFGNDGFDPYILGTHVGEMYASEYLQQGVEYMLVIEVKNDVNAIFDVVKTTNNINILHKEWVTARTEEIEFVQLSPITFLQSDLSKFSIEVDGKEVFSGSKPAKYFTDETTWQTSVTTYGSCGKFVYDSTNNTVRLPKVSDILQSTTDINALGDLIEAGLPNITGITTSAGIEGVSASGAFKSNGKVGTTFTHNSSNGTAANGFNFNASRSSSIYGKSSTVQPQTIKVLYYIVVATATKTDIEVDIDEIATDLNGKADVDLTNATPTISFATAMNTAGIRTVVETYVNGTSGYRIWSDGYCEQWAHKDNWGNISSFTFLKTFKDTNYIVVFNGRKEDSTSNLGITTITTTTINYNNSDTSLNGDLLAKGYLARGEY